jgi:hypothetical protein
MKELIIPDVHLKHRRVQEILDREPADRNIFLGDWFDDFDDNPTMNADTADWLVKRMESTTSGTDVFLLGNHDTHYLFPQVPQLICSGYNSYKAAAIRKIVKEEHRDRFRTHAFSLSGGNIMFSHAGLHPDLLPSLTVLEDIAEQAINDLKNKKMHYFFGAGYSRGGRQRIGGINWLDWSEFIDIDGAPQLVGHSVGRHPRQTGQSYCIDTNLDHYAVIEDGILSIKPFVI